MLDFAVLGHTSEMLDMLSQRYRSVKTGGLWKQLLNLYDYQYLYIILGMLAGVKLTEGLAFQGKLPHLFSPGLGLNTVTPGWVRTGNIWTSCSCYLLPGHTIPTLPRHQRDKPKGTPQPLLSTREKPLPFVTFVISLFHSHPSGSNAAQEKKSPFRRPQHQKNRYNFRNVFTAISLHAFIPVPSPPSPIHPLLYLFTWSDKKNLKSYNVKHPYGTCGHLFQTKQRK